MNEHKTILRFRQLEKINDPLTGIAREGARRMLGKMLGKMLKAEADAFVATYAGERLEDGRQRIVRHDFGPERQIQTALARWTYSAQGCATVWRVLIQPQKSVLLRTYCRNGRDAQSA